MRDPFFAVTGIPDELYRVVSRYIVVVLAVVVVHGPFAFSLAHCFNLQLVQVPKLATYRATR